MRRVVLLTTLIALLAAAPAGAATRHVVSGAGFGHGIGMSQYGAYGFAQNGVGYVRILKHYYRGTEIGRAPSRPVRVLLQASDPYVRFSGANRVAGKRIGRGLHIVRPAGGGRLRVSGAGTFNGPISVTGKGPIKLMGPAINGINSGTYRGTMVLRPGAVGGVTAINSLPIDTYLGGVVPGEMPSSWDYDALRAQAVAARTYALAVRQRGQVFDLYPDTRSQVYAGVSAETSRTNKAVADTARQVLTYDGDPVTTFYFSTSGGRTENVELSFLGRSRSPTSRACATPTTTSPPPPLAIPLLELGAGRSPGRARHPPARRRAAPWQVAPHRACASGGLARLAHAHRLRHPGAARPLRQLGFLPKGVDRPGRGPARPRGSQRPRSLPGDRRGLRSGAAVAASVGRASQRQHLGAREPSTDLPHGTLPDNRRSRRGLSRAGGLGGRPRRERALTPDLRA